RMNWIGYDRYALVLPFDGSSQWFFASAATSSLVAPRRWQ
ncbi:hypothetical protein A2U01_0004814, partial [Trifolium medium]|nr:hypothetical protein [Trifolium medium]